MLRSQKIKQQRPFESQPPFLFPFWFSLWTLRYKKEMGGRDCKLSDVFKGKKGFHTFLTAIQLQVKNLTAFGVLIRAHYNLIDLHWLQRSSCPCKMEISLLCEVLIQFLTLGAVIIPRQQSELGCVNQYLKWNFPFACFGNNKQQILFNTSSGPNVFPLTWEYRKGRFIICLNLLINKVKEYPRNKISVFGLCAFCYLLFA